MKERKTIETRRTLEFSHAELLSWIRGAGWIPAGLSAWNVEVSAREGSGGESIVLDEYSTITVTYTTRASEGDEA